MKNAIEIIAALKRAFPGHSVESIYSHEGNKYFIFIDGGRVANFEGDIDNPEIEIIVKASLYNIKDFLECDGVFYHAVERGLKEWEKGSQQNS